ncbi:MAG TPA: hypothetical protein VEK57_09640 [Thermoanaerobaculia bacterium]|nr:hypothetical protein [Thermoanaerobaculia bacterium]
MLIPLLLAAVLSMPAPAGPGAAEPHLAASRDGSLLMSWLENGALKFASYENGRWSAPKTIVQRNDLFVNWADFPSIVESNDTLYAHWLQKSGAGTYRTTSGSPPRRIAARPGASRACCTATANRRNTGSCR